MKTEKKPIRFGMIYDANSDFIKRLQNTIYVIYCLLSIAVMVCGLIILPFVTYAVLKAIAWYITYIV